MLIRYCSAPAGSGKTHSLVNRACDFAREHKRVIILQPTKELISKTIQDELLARRKPPQHYVFTQDTLEKGCSVAAELTRFFNGADNVGQMVFATHQVLPHIPYIANQHDWHLLVDEEMQVLRHQAHRIPRTHSLLTEHLELKPYNSVHSLVVPRHRSALAKMGRNKDEDEVLAQFSDTIRILTNEHFATHINTEHYERLRAGQNKTISFHSVLRPTILNGFGSVFMAAANVEDTALYQLWSRDISFELDRAFADLLRFNEHRNGDLITIHYGVDTPWSKRLAEKNAGPNDCQSIQDRLIEGIQNLFGETPFLWQANKGFAENPFGPNAQRLPNKPHGLNGYSAIDNIAFFSHLNPRTDHFRFLESHGLTAFDVRRAISFSTIYQSVMRTSIRDPKNTNSKIIVVPDREAAEFHCGW